LASTSVHFSTVTGISRVQFKPDNVLIRSGTGFISDFELSTECGSHKRTSSIGTPGYVPPEGFLKETIPHSSFDCWSVGVILLIIVTGENPFMELQKALFKAIDEGDNQQSSLLQSRLTHLILTKQHALRCNGGTLQILASMLLSINPANRPTAAACYEAVDRFLKSTVEKI
jgi:serine/threonine protein kinase